MLRERARRLSMAPKSFRAGDDARARGLEATAAGGGGGCCGQHSGGVACETRPEMMPTFPSPYCINSCILASTRVLAPASRLLRSKCTAGNNPLLRGFTNVNDLQ
jgi:hypothetical protein